MRAVLTGFAGIWLVTLAGYLAGRFGILGPETTALLARLVFYLAAPALLFSTLATSSLDKVFSPALAVFVLSTVVVGRALRGGDAAGAARGRGDHRRALRVATSTPATSACRSPPTCSATPRWSYPCCSSSS